MTTNMKINLWCAAFAFCVVWLGVAGCQWINARVPVAAEQSGVRDHVEFLVDQYDALESDYKTLQRYMDKRGYEMPRSVRRYHTPKESEK